VPRTTKDSEAAQRVARDIAEGERLGVIASSEAEAMSLRSAYIYDCSDGREWEQMRVLHKAHGGFAAAFESAASRAQLDVVRASYLRLLVNTNVTAISLSDDMMRFRATQIRKPEWDYSVATEWKDIVLASGNFKTGTFAGKTPPQLAKMLQQRFMLEPLRAQQGGREAGALNEVSSFTWNTRKWFFKEDDDLGVGAVALSSGVPQPVNSPNLNGRAVATYELARALGIEHLVVDTQVGFAMRERQVRRGIIMSGAGGLQPMKKYVTADAVARRAAYADWQALGLDIGMVGAAAGGLADPHRRAALNVDFFNNLACAEALVTATWFDFVCAQVDRHLENVFIDNTGAGNTFRGIKLIDNDLAFGTMADEAALRRLNPNVRGLPNLVPQGLRQRLQAVVAFVGDGRIFWADKDLAALPDRANYQGVSAVIAESMVAVARNLREGEFAAMMVRVALAITATNAAARQPLTQATVAAEFTLLSTGQPGFDAPERKSLWQDVIAYYRPGGPDELPVEPAAAAAMPAWAVAAVAQNKAEERAAFNRDKAAQRRG
jgi:hypothetical protein